MYDTLLDEAAQYDICVKEKPLRGYDGRIKGKRIAICRDMPTIKKACVLAEELGHYHTTVGNILNQSKLDNRKQEQRARNWAYNRMVPLDKFIEAYNNSITNLHEFAELAGVTEEFMEETLEYYRKRYGLYTSYKGYMIYFEKLSVIKIFE